MTGMTDIETLLAIEEIKLLKSRRDRACDTKDWDLYRALLPTTTFPTIRVSSAGIRPM